MVIPEKVKIGYRDYKVNMIDGNVVENNCLCYGAINHDDGNIKISKLYSEDQQKCAFIHECLHGVDNIVEAGLDEDQIRKMAKGMYQFIKDNPEIFNRGGE